MKIAVGGFQHETNTFAPSKATFEAFKHGGGWPALTVGPDVFDAVAGINLPITGFIDEWRKSTHTLVPLAWAAASPSAKVTEEAFEKISGYLIEGLRAAQADAVYLDLHGAMVTEQFDDGEGELLRRVRAVVGPNTPVMVSLDLHANVTQQMLDLADVMIAYRTYPHVDMAETGSRCAFYLKKRMDGMPRLTPHARRVPFLIPINAQSTDLVPARGIYQALAGLESSSVPALSFTPGFPAADIADCGGMVWSYGLTPAAAQHATDTIADLIEAHEKDWIVEAYEADVAVKRAMQIAKTARKPVVLADTQDNPGAGGDSDTTGMLRALVNNDAQGAALGLMVDPAAALIAHRAGVGATVELALGGKSNIPGDAPFQGRFVVEQISEGKFTCNGPMFRGARMNLGPSARLRIGGVQVVLASKKCQLADQAMYRYVGIEPTEQAILVNKSSVHFRADFTPIAEAILVAKSPGPMPVDPNDLKWTKLRKDLRLKLRTE
jgi:microcystin degradation protein MlrC